MTIQDLSQKKFRRMKRKAQKKERITKRRDAVLEGLRLRFSSCGPLITLQQLTFLFFFFFLVSTKNWNKLRIYHLKFVQVSI